MRKDILLGLLAGAIAVAVLATVVAIRSFGGADDAQPGDVCDVGLGIVRLPLTSEAFERADARLGETVERASQGDLEGARQAFFPFVHAITHDVDARLRKERKNGLAGELCENVLALETDFVILNTDTGRIAQEAQMIREILQQAAVELGYLE